MEKGNKPSGWETYDNCDDWLKAIRKNMANGDDDEKTPRKVTDIDAAKENIDNAVMAFNERWAPMPRFSVGVEVMDQRQLRDAMGLRATIDTGDPWPAAEKTLVELGFKWHWVGGMRVMFVQERDSFVQAGDDWEDGEEVGDEETTGESLN